MRLSDADILAALALPDSDPNRLRITPFHDGPTPGCISYGLTSAGYDVRVADEFLVFTNMHTRTVDPKGLAKECFVRHVAVSECVIPPNSFALAKSLEVVRIPRDVIATCVGKSTYARCGIIVTVTPLEPEWEGQITVEISNTTPCPARIYAMEGIMQVMFDRTITPCHKSYADKKGRYQGQRGITLPFVR